MHISAGDGLSIRRCQHAWVGGRGGEDQTASGAPPLRCNRHLLFWSAPGPVWHFILSEGREIRPGLAKGVVAWSAPAAAVNVASRIATSNRGCRRLTSWRVTRSRRQCRQIPATRDAVGFVWKGGEGWVLPGVPKPPQPIWGAPFRC